MLFVNFNQNNINNTTFYGIKPSQKGVTKVVRKEVSQIDYSQFDPYFLKILIEEGCSIKEIAHDIGQTVCRTRQILSHFNLKTQISMLIDAIKLDELKKLLDAKKSQKEIAEYFMIDRAGALTPLIKKVAGKKITQLKTDSIPKEELQKLADDGLNCIQISEHYKVSPQFIIKRMDELGIRPIQMLHREKTISVEELKHYLFDLDLCIKDIAQRYNIPVANITKVMRENNIKTPGQQKAEKIPTKQEMINARMDCNTLTEYANRLGISCYRAKKFMTEYNIQPFVKVFIKDPSAILELLKKNPNMSVDEIARELDLPPQSIDTAIRKFYIPIMHTSRFHHVVSIHTAEIFKNNIARGDTPTQLAEQFGVSSNKIVNIADSINSYITQEIENCAAIGYKCADEQFLLKNCDLSACKPSPDKETVENCIKVVCGSWEKLQNLYNAGEYNRYTKMKNKLLQKLHISEDTLNYLVSKYNIA